MILDSTEFILSDLLAGLSFVNLEVVGIIIVGFILSLVVGLLRR